ncbi:hypothetical protein [Streptomyces sannanensis]
MATEDHNVVGDIDEQSRRADRGGRRAGAVGRQAQALPPIMPGRA